MSNKLDPNYKPDGAIQAAFIWLEAALNCRDFIWDWDQHEVATQALEDAKLEWKELTK